MIVVVSDTSPVRALDHLGLLPLFGELYGQITVPPAVQSKLESPPPQLTAIEVTEFDFIEVRSPRDTGQVQQFLQSLHPGESEALALALELRAAAVSIDEEKGRKAAAQAGIRPLGTLGVLLEAKAEGHVQEICTLVDKLVGEIGFFVSGELKRKVLQLAGE